MKIIESSELKSLCQSPGKMSNIVIVDIREPDEYAREHIEGSINLPLSQWGSINTKQYKDKIVLVHCLSGRRTRQAQDKLSQLECRELLCISGGIQQWKSCGLSTQRAKKAPIEIRRQVQIIIGFMILLGVLLAQFVSPLFILISAFFGGGLLFAGITGWCGLAKVLMQLPYNQLQLEGEHHD